MTQNNRWWHFWGGAVAAMGLWVVPVSVGAQIPVQMRSDAAGGQDDEDRGSADDPDEAEASARPGGAEGSEASPPPTETPAPSVYEVTVYSGGSATPSLPGHRAKSEVERADLERRIPRSAPDALRYEPGVFVQQTAHSQGSAFIRGLTGQQTLLLFDGIRLNNSTYRQGPNQYFFTLDSQTIESIQVIRGGSSTRYGSDALGGVIMALPVEPRFPGPVASDAVTVEPHLRLKSATADDQVGGRAELNLTTCDSIAFFGGAGRRQVGLLESGGVVRNPEGGGVPLVPRFAEDGRTQLGTGFNEMTGDGRWVLRGAGGQTFKLAAYGYRQFDAPRTDQCPAAFAPYDECLTYDEQARTLVYGAWEGGTDFGLAPFLRATLSWQRQHERRTLSRPSSAVENIGRDTVDTFGATLVGTSRGVDVLPYLRLSGSYGVDTYWDRIQSAAWIAFTDIDVLQQRSRGQYLDHSTYLYGGAFAEGVARLSSSVRLQAGGRWSWIVARAPADSESGSVAVHQSWFPLVGNVGLEWRATPWLRLTSNVDRSFRAPNLDDMTSRQQTGPGFQFENPDLSPEIATTLEVGAALTKMMRAEVWLFRTLIDGAVIKSPKPDTDCPPNTARCPSSWSRFQLVNADEPAEIRGVEGTVLVPLPAGFEGRASVTWTWGEGPNVGDPPSDPDASFRERVPLSRIPPLNGTGELVWRHGSSLSVSTGLRWAAEQDRLALADVADERIPRGGTPGFAVVDLNVTYRWERLLVLSLSLENLFDAAYRYHGSSVNGPGRGLVLLVDMGALWRL